MKIMNKFFINILLGISLSGCADLPILPKNSMPMVNESQIYTQTSSFTPWLDCLSGMLGQEKKSYRITVDVIPNTFVNQAGISLPGDFKPFVETSMQRVINGYRLFDSIGMSGMTGFSRNLEHIAAPETITKAVLLADHINADIVLSGSLYLAHQSSSASVGGEVMIAGLNGEVKSYDIGAHLIAKNARNAEIIVQHSLKVRIFSAEHGLSVFSIDDGKLIQAKTGFFRAPSMLHGLQMLSDFLVASTIRDLSSALYSRSYSACNQEIPGIDNSRVPIQSQKLTSYDQKWIQLVRKGDAICLKKAANTKGPQINPQENLAIRFQQYASSTALNIPLDPVMTARASAERLLSGELLCLQQNYIDKRAKNLECEVRDEKGQIIGTAVDSL